MSTPHNSADKGDFAKTVLMPGDPLRAEFIAKTYLKNPILVNNVRGIQGYTGEYKGKKVSVMASGMGMPSIGIYSYELYNFYDVENIIRIGSAGGLTSEVKIRDIVFGMGACTDSSFVNQYGLPGNFSPIADFELLNTAVNNAKHLQVDYHVGNIVTSDVFYCNDSTVNKKWSEMGVLAVDMETAALYMTAARCKRKALAILTVSDNLVTKEETTAQERQNSFTQMIEIALETAVKI